MRILAGQYKGRKIQPPGGTHYRPTQSRVRKAIFDILGDLNGMSVVDLFAGSGILGFESASRGAESVTFVDNSNDMIRWIRKNMKPFGNTDFRVIHQDVYTWLPECAPVDVILADPPYGQVDTISLVELSVSHLNIGGRFILETNRKNPLEGDRTKNYGDTKLVLWERK